MSTKLTNAMLINLVLQSYDRGVKHGEFMERAKLQEQRDKLATLENERTQALVAHLARIRAEYEEGGKSDAWVRAAFASLDPRPSPEGREDLKTRYPSMFKEKT